MKNTVKRLPPTIARCSLGHIGLVTSYKKVTYENGEMAMAHTGYHLWPFRLIGKPWSSRKPTWIWRLLAVRSGNTYMLDIYTAHRVRCHTWHRHGSPV